ncbi:MAG: PKD domain-containing protein [Flavobacteriales bacterium]|nr:PKD domain-containing protein [Flavobacteriales bacterium]
MAKKNIIIVLVFGSFILMHSCTKPVKACFDVEIIEGSGQVNFDASCTENSFLYEWDFGNGVIETTWEPMVSQEYEPGTYTVLLRVERKDGSNRKDEPELRKTLIID